MSNIAISTPFGGVQIPAIALGVGAAVLLGAAAYAAYKVFDFAKDPNKGTAYEGNGPITSVGGAVATLGNVTNQVLNGVPQTIGEALGSGLYSLFNGSYDPGVTLIINFPDGSKHAVNGSDIDSGSFNYKGVHYTLVDRNNLHYAVVA